MSPVERLIQSVERWTGIDLARGGKSDSLERLVGARARELGHPSIEAYVESMTSAVHPEVGRLLNAVTVNHTWFYRDAEQLDVVAQLLREGRLAGDGQRVNIWVPGCATGEDVWSLAMIARDAGRDVLVLGTDINSEVLALAARARYGEWSAREVPVAMRGHLTRVSDGYEVSVALRGAVSFERHNLVDPPPAAPGVGGWHLILCRNVLIYFTREKTTATVAALGRALRPDGRLLLGASDILQLVPRELRVERIGTRYIYRRARAGEPAQPETKESVGQDLAGPGRPGVRSAWESSPGDGAPPAPMQRVQSGVAAVISLANARLEAGETSDAIAMYAKALEMDPLSAEARFYTGVAHHVSGDPSSAAQALRGALLLDPDLWPASFYLALSYDKLGRTADAQREYRRVVESDGSSPALRSRSALLGDLTAFRRDVERIARSRAGGGVRR